MSTLGALLQNPRREGGQGRGRERRRETGSGSKVKDGDSSVGFTSAMGSATTCLSFSSTTKSNSRTS